MTVIDQILVDGQPVDKAALRSYLAAREYLSVRDFGALGDGVNDDSEALQAAVTAAAGQPLWLPPGSYLLGKPLMFTSPTNTHAPGPRLFGAGPTASRLIYRGSGAAITVTQGAGYRFLKGGILQGLGLEGNGGSPDQHGLSVTGAWQWLLEDVVIRGFGGDAIASPWRSDLGAVFNGVERRAGDPILRRPAGSFLIRLRRTDAVYGDGIPAGAVITEVIDDSSIRLSLPAESTGIGDLMFSGNTDSFQSLLALRQVRMMACGGWGIAGRAGLGLIIDWHDCTIQQCAGGGALLGGTARLNAGIIADNGAAADPALTAGLRLIRAPGTPQNVTVERIEFDSNRGAQVRLEWVGNARLFQSRFISHINPANGTLVPPVGVVVGSAVAGGGGARNIRIEQCAFRADAQGAAPYAGVEIGAAGTYADVEVNQPLWITLTPPNQVKVAGAPHPDAAVRMIESGRVTLGTPLLPLAVLARRAADGVLVPGEELDAGLSQLLRGNAELLGAGIPMNGAWRIELHLTIAGLATGDGGVAIVQIGPDLTRELEFRQPDTGMITVSGSWTVLANAGWRVSCRVRRGAGSTVARLMGGGQFSTLAISQVA